jgi:hypothetical protein
MIAKTGIAFLSFSLTEKLKTKEERKNVANTLLKELSVIETTLKRKEPYKATTLAFDSLVSKISLFHPDTIWAMLFIYNDLHFMLRPNSTWAQKDYERLYVNIDSAIMFLDREAKRRL